MQIEAAVAAICPFGHTEQVEAPAAVLEYWPTGQSMHIVAEGDPKPAPYLPNAHAVHALDPRDVEYAPLGHTAQTDRPAALAYFPAGQAEQTASPDREKYPAEQDAQYD